MVGALEYHAAEVDAVVDKVEDDSWVFERPVGTEGNEPGVFGYPC